MSLVYFVARVLSTCGKFQFLESSRKRNFSMGMYVAALCSYQILLQPYEQKGASVLLEGIDIKGNRLSGLEILVI